MERDDVVEENGHRFRRVVYNQSSTVYCVAAGGIGCDAPDEQKDSKQFRSSVGHMVCVHRSP